MFRTATALLATLAIVARGLSAQITGLAGWDILLDPGHYQQNNMGIYNYSEAHKNLRVALALRQLLLIKTDIDTVYMSRTDDDQIVGLTQRTDLANQLGTAWFHSIHSNAAPNSTTNSALMLYGEPKERTSLRGGKAMSEIMVVHLATGMRIPKYGAVGECQFYYGDPNCAQTRNHVNRESNMPSELSEAGYHTSSIQNQLNMNSEWKRLEAYTFFWSILQYHGIARPPVRILTGIVRDSETGRPINGATVIAAGQTYVTDTYESLFRYYSGDPYQLGNGFYFLEDLAVDSVLVVVDADGYFPDSIRVNLDDTFFTFMDVELQRRKYPWVTTTTPYEGDSTTWINDPISIEFSQPMDEASVVASLVPAGGTARWKFWSQSGRKLTIVPDSLQPATAYRLTVPATARDTAGLLLDGDDDFQPGGDFHLDFVTGPNDRSPPLVLSSNPMPSQETQRDAILSFYFNELLDTSLLSGGEIKLRPNGFFQSIHGRQSHRTFMGRSVLAFTPDQPLEPDVEYRLQLASGLTDRSGNVSGQQQSLVFSIDGGLYFFSSLESFHGDVLGRWKLLLGTPGDNGSVAERAALYVEPPDSSLPAHTPAVMRLDYTWNSQIASQSLVVVLQSRPPDDQAFISSYFLDVHLFGDASSNSFSIDLHSNDASGSSTSFSTEELPIDWTGWRRIMLPITANNDGNNTIDTVDNTPLYLSGIRLTHSAGGALYGSLMLAGISLAYPRSDNENPLPVRMSLHPAYPNPFNDYLSIPFDIATPARISLVILDLLGREVARLQDGYFVPSSYTVTWFGAGIAGQPAASGVYFILLNGPDFRETRKVILLK